MLFVPQKCLWTKKKNDEIQLRVAAVPMQRAGGGVSCVPSADFLLKIDKVAPRAVAQTVAPGSALPADWALVVSKLALAGLARELASHCELVAHSADLISLRLSNAHRHLLSRSSQDKLQAALVEYFGVSTVNIVLGDILAETPAQLDFRRKDIEREGAIAAIESDQVVREIIESLDASMVDGSIQSLANSL